MQITEFGPALFSLTGRRALVVGGNGGLGHGFSVALAACGADVCIASLADDDGSTGQLVRERGGRFSFVAADLTVAGEPARVVEQCVRELGGLDILVNSAGLNLLADVQDFGRREWDAMVAVNLTSVFETAHAAAAVMIPQRAGKIITVASLFSFLGGRRSPAYAATKAGVMGFTKAYADELGEYGIQVNAIAPGYVATAMTEQTRSDPVSNARIVDHVPAGRWAEPADLMGALVFLASPAADYVTGHTLVVDGGYLVR